MKTYEAREVHDWSDIRALGDAVVIELVGIITKTRTGIHVPDTARLDVWVVIATGPEVKGVHVGDRVMFGGEGISNIDGRMFAIDKKTGEVAWDGDVEVFELSGSDKPLRCYAWIEATTGTKRRFFAVLGVGQIDSATRAVRASILMDSTAT